MRSFALRTAALAVAMSLSGVALAEKTIITIESWRTEDQAIWDEKILPVFEAAYPEIPNST